MSDTEVHGTALSHGLGGVIGATFLHQSAVPAAVGGASKSVLITAGTDTVPAFSLVSGDTLDLTQILAGASLTHDLTNIGNFVKVLGSGSNDPGYGQGTKTTLEITGPHGSALVNLEGSGKLTLKDLLSHDSLILPPH